MSFVQESDQSKWFSGKFPVFPFINTYQWFTTFTTQCCLVCRDQSLYAKMRPNEAIYSEISDLYLWQAQYSTVPRHDSTSVSWPDKAIRMSFSLFTCVCRICYTDSIGIQEDQYPPNIAVKVNQSYCHVPVSCFPSLRQATPSECGCQWLAVSKYSQ